MDDKKAFRVSQIAEELLEPPRKWGWQITAVLYGHGKVIVQCVTPKGHPVQFTRKVNDEEPVRN